VDLLEYLSATGMLYMAYKIATETISRNVKCGGALKTVVVAQCTAPKIRLQYPNPYTNGSKHQK